MCTASSGAQRPMEVGELAGAAELQPLLMAFFAVLDLAVAHHRHSRAGVRLRRGPDPLGRAQPAASTRLAPGPGSCGRLSDPVLLPLERRIFRAGGNPQNAPLWLLGIVIGGGPGPAEPDRLADRTLSCASWMAADGGPGCGSGLW